MGKRRIWKITPLKVILLCHPLTPVMPSETGTWIWVIFCLIFAFFIIFFLMFYVRIRDWWVVFLFVSGSTGLLEFHLPLCWSPSYFLEIFFSPMLLISTYNGVLFIFTICIASTAEKFFYWTVLFLSWQDKKTKYIISMNRWMCYIFWNEIFWLSKGKGQIWVHFKSLPRIYVSKISYTHFWVFYL